MSRFAAILFFLLGSLGILKAEPLHMEIISPDAAVNADLKLVFGQAPPYIELASVKSVLIDFPSRETGIETFGVRSETDSIQVSSGDLLLVKLDKAGSFELHAYSKAMADGGNVFRSTKDTMTLKVLRKKPLITNDAVVFGLLFLCLALIFYASSSQIRAFQVFFKYVPALLMCYLVPSILVSVGLISAELSKTYSIAKDYLLPTALILMTLSIDMKGIIRLGSKSLIMFLTATAGIILGGPLAILIVSTFSPETVGGSGFDAVWRGLSTLAGSWIGGGANQTAMLEIYQYNPQKYGAMVLVDIVVANIWMAFLLLGVGNKDRIDRWLKADSSAITALQEKVEAYTKSITVNPTLRDLMVVLGVGFAVTGLSHLIADWATSVFSSIPSLADSVLNSGFFWIVVCATTFGLALSFTKARQLEGYGASKLGSVFIYILVATIGMKMDIRQIVENPMLILVGIIWMALHVALLFAVAKLIKAPYFFLAVGSKANIGGAASAPVVAAAFHPSLAPVGVLLAVLGYALGTYGAILCAQLMELASRF